MGEHEEPYVRLVHEFVRGHEWTQHVTLFLQSHCRAFATLDGAVAEAEGKAAGEGFDHRQWELFTTFEQWADTLLAQQLEQLGVSEDEFVAMLQRKLREGPETQLRDRIHDILDVIDSMGSFDRFVDLMRDTNGRLCREEANEVAWLQTQLDMREWDLQLALASSLVDNGGGGILLDQDAVLLPWARSVLALQVAMERAGAPGRDPLEEEEEIGRLSRRLMHERLHVEFAIAERMRSEGTSAAAPAGEATAPVANSSGGAPDHADTTLGLLLDDIGKTQLAIGQQRALLRSEHAALSDRHYEQVYVCVREELRHRGKEGIQGRVAERVPVSRTQPYLVDRMVHLVCLEDHLQRTQKELVLELDSPGSVTFSPMQLQSGGSVRRLSIDPDAAQTTFVGIQSYLNTPKSPITGKNVESPDEALDVVKQMHENLRLVMQNHEATQARARLQATAEDFKQSKSPDDMRKMYRLAGQAAELEAMLFAENGEALMFPLVDDWNGDDIVESGQFEGDSDSDATESDSSDSECENEAASDANGSKPRPGLRIKANGPESAAHKLRETERLRKQLLLRANPAPFTPGASLQLNSPKPGGPPQGAGATRGPQQVTAELSINPTSLRYLASNLGR